MKQKQYLKKLLGTAFATALYMKQLTLFFALAIGLLPCSIYGQKKAPVKPKSKTTVKTVKAGTAKNDTVYYYYSNKKVSVKVLPWADNEQQIWLFSPAGAKTYTLTNSRKHGYTRTELSFDQGGNVKQALVTTHPDAGLYGYKSTISFDASNTPLQMESVKDPMQNLEMPAKYNWNKATGTWVREKSEKEGEEPGY